MIKKVLLPVNDQESALVAIECAMARKWSFDTSFLLCTIVEDITLIPEGCSVEHKEILASEQQEHAKEMEVWLAQARDLFSQVFPNTEAVVQCGRIPQKICEIAEDWGADYILIGSHSFSLANKVALRGVAAQVLALAPCTVEAVRFPQVREMLTSSRMIDIEQLRERAGQAPKKILIASDLSLQAMEAIDWVANQDWGTDSQIRLITVFVSAKKDSGLAVHEKVHSYTEERKYQKHLEQELRIQAKRILAQKPKIKLECFLAQSDSILHGIIDEAETWGADLVITGAQGASRTSESKAGSNAIKIMEQLDCSMIAVRDGGANAVHFSWFEALQ